LLVVLQQMLRQLQREDD